MKTNHVYMLSSSAIAVAVLTMLAWFNPSAMWNKQPQAFQETLPTVRLAALQNNHPVFQPVLWKIYHPKKSLAVFEGTNHVSTANLEAAENYRVLLSFNGRTHIKEFSIKKGVVNEVIIELNTPDYNPQNSIRL